MCPLLSVKLRGGRNVVKESEETEKGKNEFKQFQLQGLPEGSDPGGPNC